MSQPHWTLPQRLSNMKDRTLKKKRKKENIVYCKMKCNLKFIRGLSLERGLPLLLGVTQSAQGLSNCLSVSGEDKKRCCRAGENNRNKASSEWPGSWQVRSYFLKKKKEVSVPQSWNWKRDTAKTLLKSITAQAALSNLHKTLRVRNV